MPVGNGLKPAKEKERKGKGEEKRREGRIRRT
jgi:hypothetical protein